MGLERELEIDEQHKLYVADTASLADEDTGATTWDCGLVLAHYLIKQHELGEVRFHSTAWGEQKKCTAVVCMHMCR